MEINIETQIKHFTKFYQLITEKSPPKYSPWLFPCNKNNKNPAPRVIYERATKQCPNCNSNWVIKGNALMCQKCNIKKGSWHMPYAKLSFNECIELIKQGYNIGISARQGDALIILDIDDEKYLNQMPGGTLIIRSRKRLGLHGFFWNMDNSVKINLPAKYGEIRSDNQYVLAAGSYVPFSEKDAIKAVSEGEMSLESSKEILKDELLGYYTVENEATPRKITINEIPQFFKDQIEENTKSKIEMETKDFDKNRQKSKIWSLKISDIISTIPNARVGHPLHSSDTNANFSVSNDGNLAHCWRHLVSLNAIQFLCVKTGFMECQDAGTPHKGRGFSKIKGNKKAILAAWKEAKSLKLIPENDKYPFNKQKKRVNVSRNVQDLRTFGKGYIRCHPIYYDKNGLFWVWKGKNWKMKDEVDIMNDIDIVINPANINTLSSKNKAEILELMRRLGRLNKPKDLSKNWVQFKNKLYNFKNGKIKKAKPKYFCVNVIPWKVGKSEETPIIDKLCAEWVGKEQMKLLYQVMAYCMYRAYPIHRLFYLYGAGSNGKSQFLDLLITFLGVKNCCSSDINKITQNRFEPAKLFKKLMCQIAEVPFKKIDNTTIIKSLTSGKDLIGYEIKNKGLWDGYNYAKIIMSTNSMPMSSDKTHGWYRRNLIITFSNTFTEGKNIVDKIPDNEYENLCLKLIKILPDLLECGKFHNEGTIKDRKKRYEELSNPIAKFIKEYYEIDANESVPLFEFVDAITPYLVERKYRILTKSEVEDFLKNDGYLVQSQKKKKENGNYTNWKMIFGIKRKLTFLTKMTPLSHSFFPRIRTSENMESNKSKKSQYTDFSGYVTTDETPKDKLTIFTELISKKTKSKIGEFCNVEVILSTVKEQHKISREEGESILKYLSKRGDIYLMKDRVGLL